MTISLTDIEAKRIFDACSEYTDMMGQGEDTCEYTAYLLENGLGSALRKISKGSNAQRVYGKYKTVRQCPTFDEWKAAKAESENEE